MNPISTHRDLFLAASAYRAEGAPPVVGNEYDFVLAASSWDPRCLGLLDREDLRSHTAALLLFDNRGGSGRRDEHDAALRDFLSRRSEKVHEIAGASEDLDGIWARLSEVLAKTYAEVGRPLRVLIELSACPRYYSLGILGTALRERMLSTADLIYREAKYEPSQAAEQFTVGRWRTAAVPGLEGEYDPAGARHYVVSVGFEGEKTYRLVSGADPDRVSVLFPDPGFDPDYPARTRASNQLLLDDFGVPDASVVAAPAGDAVAAWSALASASLEKDTDNAYYVCAGTKPHALALALRAAARGGPALLYVQPIEHRETAVEPRGPHWLFRVQDLSVPVPLDPQPSTN